MPPFSAPAGTITEPTALPPSADASCDCLALPTQNSM